MSFKQVLTEFGKVSDKLLDQINTSIIAEQLPKGEKLIKQGETAKKLYYLDTGSSRSYTLNDGNDITTWFSFAGEFITPFTSFFPQQPSYENIELLEDATLLRFDYHKFQGLRNASPEFEKVVNHFIVSYTIQLEERLLLLQTASAREKYLHLLQKFPKYVQHITSKHLASYLGISRETLSRMRSEIS